MKVLFLFVFIGLTLAARRSYERYVLKYAEEYFEEFMTTYNKSYNDKAEKQARFEIFKRNLEIINEMNSRSNDTEYGITKFTDLTKEEFIKMYTGLNGFNTSKCEAKIHHPSNEAPESFDWREQQKVSRVKDQGQCGSCWAFSATGNIESQYAIKYNKLLEFSEQQLVDCDTRSFGCSGALIESPFFYWTDTTGPMLEDDYPYTAKSGTCKADASKVKAKVTGCYGYYSATEDHLKDLIPDIGPLTIAVDGSDFAYYRGGIFRGCSQSPDVNHAVLLVGYGTEQGTPYWLIKNSWGENFGEAGYIKLPRGVNACGLNFDDKIVAAIA